MKRILAKSEETKRIKVKEVMSTPLKSIEPNVEIGDASRLMFQKNIKKMPIVRKDELLGLVTPLTSFGFNPNSSRCTKYSAPVLLQDE